MGSEDYPKLYFLDFSNPQLKADTAEWESLKSQLREALEEYGCFEASFDKVAAEIRSSVLECVEELFDLPLETKLEGVSETSFSGYVGQYPQTPLYESVGIDDARNPQQVQAFTNTFWPQGNPNFSKTMQSYSEQLSEFDQIIRRMTVESFGLEKYMDQHMSSTMYELRLMKYKGPQTHDTKLGLTSHTDKNVVTILCQDKVGGLEVQTKDGTWIKFRPSTPNSFIVMIGDSLLAWLNGRVHSPFHRVMMSGNKARYSVGLFSVPKAGCMVEAPVEMVDEQHPLLFKPFDYGDYLSFYYYRAPAGKIGRFPLKEYCGI